MIQASVGRAAAPTAFPRLLSLVRWYYVATPIFWLLDVIGDVPLRAAFLDHFPVGQHAYYAVCSAIGVIGLRAPRHTRDLALLESVANISLLILSVGIWYVAVLDWAAGPSAVIAAPGAWHVVNFVISAAVAGTSYQVHVLARRGAGPSG